jgi:hypothetical protein
VANAATLRHRLGQPVPGEYPDEMLARYPFLASSVSGMRRASLLDEDVVREDGKSADDGGGGGDRIDEDGAGPEVADVNAEDAEPQEG